jgi:hypothetical protein
MSRVHDRDQLVAQLTRELPDRSLYEVVELARKLLRAGTTLQRLAEAQCNGDWPYDQGNYHTEGKPEAYAVCPRCEQSCRKARMKRTAYMTEGTGGRTYYRPECPDCRTQARVTKLLAEYGMRPIFQGDPRGPVFKVIPPSYAERNAGRPPHDLEGIYVS